MPSSNFDLFTKWKYSWIVTIFIIIWLSSPIKLQISLILFGFLLGYVYTNNPQMQNITLPDIQLPQYKLEMHTSNFNDLPKILKISLDRIFTRCISQFVDSWYCQANKSQNTEFQQCLRSCMEKSVCNLKNYINIADVPTLCTYAFTNALIIHLVLINFNIYRESSKNILKQESYLLNT